MLKKIPKTVSTIVSCCCGMIGRCASPYFQCYVSRGVMRFQRVRVHVGFCSHRCGPKSEVRMSICHVMLGAAHVDLSCHDLAVQAVRCELLCGDGSWVDLCWGLGR